MEVVRAGAFGSAFPQPAHEGIGLLKNGRASRNVAHVAKFWWSKVNQSGGSRASHPIAPSVDETHRGELRRVSSTPC